MALLQGCIQLRSIEGPMNTVDDLLDCPVRPSTLVVMLPGAYDKPQDFIDQGFVSEIRKRKINADIRLVDAHIAYYTNQQIVQRLDKEIVTTAKSQGYTNIWFAGISLGGYGTLLYSAYKPEAINGFYTMSPYMGSRDVPNEVKNQGGLKNWTSDVKNNVDIDLWRSLKAYTDSTSNLPQSYLGFGESDRFASVNRIFAEVLPSTKSFVIPGGHDWATWRLLWNHFLDAAPLPRIEHNISPCSSH